MVNKDKNRTARLKMHLSRIKEETLCRLGLKTTFVMVAFSLHARIFWKKVGKIILRLWFLFIFKRISARAQQFLYFSQDPQWLGELTRLWTSVSWWVAWELVSLIGSNTMPEQHDRQPTPTVWGFQVLSEWVLVIWFVCFQWKPFLS